MAACLCLIMPVPVPNHRTNDATCWPNPWAEWAGSWSNRSHQTRSRVQWHSSSWPGFACASSAQCGGSLCSQAFHHPEHSRQTQRQRHLPSRNSCWCCLCISFFTMRCHASAVHATALCLSVTSRCSTKMAQHKNTWQCLPHNSKGTLRFLTPKISAKFDQGQPLRGRQMQVEWVKISDFWQTTGYIWKTVQDRCTVSIKVE